MVTEARGDPIEASMFGRVAARRFRSLIITDERAREGLEASARWLEVSQ